MPGSAPSHAVPGAETSTEQQHRDETAFENVRHARRGLARDGVCLDFHTCGGRRVLPDVISAMRSCGFNTMDQCKAMSSGRGGDCYPNPFPSNSSASNGTGNAFAYQPKHPRSRLPINNVGKVTA
jgi:hypothetical protein